MKYFSGIFLLFCIATNVFGQTKQKQNIFADSTFFAQKSRADSAIVKVDTISQNDTLAIPMANSEIKDIINYQAEDSIVYDLTAKKMYLYNGAKLSYEKIKLKANAIDFDWNTYEMLARGTKADSLAEEEEGKPEFEDDGKTYMASKMTYNFKTQKGKVFEVMTQEGGAYLHSEAVKKLDNNEWFGYKSKFTTCELEHPHFFFKAKKIKMIPNKVMVTGPANLWIGDMPTPIYVPFGIFPVKQGKRSGIIPPKPAGFAQVQGIGLTDFGYYWAINEHMDWKNLATIFTTGNLQYSSTFRLKYNYILEAIANFNYSLTPPNDIDKPDANWLHNFKIGLNVNLDPKVAPTNTFSANINFITSKFNKTQLTNNIGQITQTNYSSNINYQKFFTKIPWLVLNLSASHSQNVASRDFSVSLPIFGINVSRVSPFKSKINTGKPKWYENIGVTYVFEAKYFLNTYDSLIGNADTWRRNGQFGIKNNINIDAPFTVLKYFTVNPSFSYNERWYFKSVNKTWITQDAVVNLPGRPPIILPGVASYVKTDTINKFVADRDFSTSITLSTKLIGTYNFKGKLVKSFRHILTPSISGNFRPDFGTPYWGYYDSVRTTINDTKRSAYSRFENVSNFYGNANPGMVGSIRFSLGNTFDVKLFSKKDSIKHEKKTPFIIERVTISGGYNFAAKVNKIEDVIISGSMRFLENISGSFSFDLDPYALDSLGRKSNKFYWKTNHQLLRLSSANFSLDARLRSKAVQNTSPTNNTQALPFQKGDYVIYNPDVPYDFSIPWDLGVFYNFNLSQRKSVTTQRDTNVINQTIGVTGNINVTKNWKVAVSTGFDINSKQPTLTKLSVVRNLHCWKLAISWVAYPLNYQSFVIELSPVSGLLQDLKIPYNRAANQNFTY